ncbi:MAG: zf-HC2 domain-containing protein [Spirochaetaceae bacterium]|jgi:hypothetical protein|nr:zf-HC2 domain-containing protein [Spirochaetaceae bacterium]GMO29595.1 MAG: hypothetical protein Pg6A_17900 [Termitinemataceae bacterium]
MCPNNQILSVYVDDELPLAIKERVAAHIAGCAECASKTAEYASLSRAINCLSEVSGKPEDAAGRVWQRLEPRLLFRKAARPALWRRELRLPLPVAAAAALAVFICFAGLFYRLGGAEHSQTAAAFPLEETQINIPAGESYGAAALPAHDMRDVIQFLEDETDSDIVIIKLPESKKFNRYGGPRFIRASDLKGEPVKYE